jgi:hypothetical protein
MSPEDLYYEIGGLAAEMPDLGSGPITPETRAWLEQLVALIGSRSALADQIQLSVAIENLDGPLRARNARTILSIVHRALAKAELDAPPEVRGAFIIASNAFDAFTAVRKVLTTARTDVLLIDPAADAKVLTDFAVLAPDHVTVRLLIDRTDNTRSLASAARRWTQQFGRARPLLVRLADNATLHHTLVLVDGATAWALGQPFNMLGKRAYPALVRVHAAAAGSVIAAHSEIWKGAVPLRDA